MYVYEKRLQCPVNIKIRNPQDIMSAGETTCSHD